MISVNEALTLIGEQRADYGSEAVLLPQSAGRVLAQDVIADRDFPPYNRVTMDGVAINAAAFAAGARTFQVKGLQAAGNPPLQLADPAHCMEVMTGAVLPGAADAVVPYEDCTLDNGVAMLHIDSISQYQNVHMQGTDSTRGERLILEGTRITPAMTGIMASVGLGKPLVRRLPGIAVCATGDELVDVDAMPQAHQVRRSNSYMLAAALLAEGIAADSYHLPDDKAQMNARLSSLLHDYDVLLFSGAVSKGKLDFLPEVLAALGMKIIFHRVAQKPGKPFLFGRFAGGPLVFGFPGNPVSTLVCYKIFFLHWLNHSLRCKPAVYTAQLAEDIALKPVLTYHLLVALQWDGGILLATPCAGANSGDMVGLAKADAMLMLPAEKADFRKGESYPLTLLAPIF